MKYTAVIIGLGNIGLSYDLESTTETRMTHTFACLSHNSISNVYGIDPDAERRLIFENQTNCQSFANISDLKEDSIDLCIICTPSNLREEIVKQCIGLSPKAILIEKPLSQNISEAKHIKASCSESGIPLYVNYIRLFDSQLIDLKKRIKEKEFGNVCGGQCFFSGEVLNIASHYISLLVNFFGVPEKVVSLCCEKSKEIFVMEYENFNFVFQAVSTEYAMGEIDLLFPEYKISLKKSCMQVDISKSKSNPVFPEYKCLGSTETFSADLLNYQYNVLDYVISNISKGKHDSDSLENAYQTLGICMSLS